MFAFLRRLSKTEDTVVGEPWEMDVEVLAERRKAGDAIAILDVRDPWEAECCALEGSLHIPLSDLQRRAAELPKDRPLVVMCHLGGRSAQAVSWLRSKGFSRAINLQGGIDAWARRIDPSMRVYR